MSIFNERVQCYMMGDFCAISRCLCMGYTFHMARMTKACSSMLFVLHGQSSCLEARIGKKWQGLKCKVKHKNIKQNVFQIFNL
jgi:hypothetical protein